MKSATRAGLRASALYGAPRHLPPLVCFLTQVLLHDSEWNPSLAVLKTFLNFVLAPLPRGSWGRVRSAIFQTHLEVWGRFRPGSGG